MGGEEQAATWARFYAIEADSRPGELEYDRALAAAKKLEAAVAEIVAAGGGAACGRLALLNSSRTPAASLLDDRRPRLVALARGRALASAGHSRRAAAVTHRQHHNYGNCNIINDRCNPLVSLVALDEPPTHRRRYEMNLLSRRSVLAIAAVVDVALHSRSAPVAAKALAARHKLPSRHLETLLQGLVHAKILKGVRGPRGGYELARERRRITVGEIVRTAMSLSTADPDDLGSNSVLLERVIDPAVRRAGETFLGNLDAITVEQMCETAEKTHVLDDEKVSGDFAI